MVFFSPGNPSRRAFGECFSSGAPGNGCTGTGLRSCRYLDTGSRKSYSLPHDKYSYRAYFSRPKSRNLLFLRGLSDLCLKCLVRSPGRRIRPRRFIFQSWARRNIPDSAVSVELAWCDLSCSVWCNEDAWPRFRKKQMTGLGHDVRTYGMTECPDRARMTVHPDMGFHVPFGKVRRRGLPCFGRRIGARAPLDAIDNDGRIPPRPVGRQVRAPALSAGSVGPYSETRKIPVPCPVSREEGRKASTVRLMSLRGCLGATVWYPDQVWDSNTVAI